MAHGTEAQTQDLEAWFWHLAVSPTYCVTLGKPPLSSLVFGFLRDLGWAVWKELSVSEPLSLEFPLVLRLAKQVSLPVYLFTCWSLVSAS